MESLKARQEGILGITQSHPLILPMKRQRPREGSCLRFAPAGDILLWPPTPGSAPSIHSSTGHQVSLSIFGL